MLTLLVAAAVLYVVMFGVVEFAFDDIFDLSDGEVASLALAWPVSLYQLRAELKTAFAEALEKALKQRV